MDPGNGPIATRQPNGSGTQLYKDNKEDKLIHRKIKKEFLSLSQR